LEDLKGRERRSDFTEEDEEFFVKQRRLLEQDTKLCSRWEKALYGKPIDCNDFFDGFARVVNRLAKVVNVDPMLLLALSGSSSPIGRVAVSSHEVDALLRRQQFPGEKLEEILAWDGAEDIFAGLVDRYILRAGISGVQPKVLVPEQQDTTPQRFTSKNADLIIKSGRDEFPGLAIN